MADTRRRVLLQRLNADHKWDERGTGHVSSQYVDRLKGMSLMVKAESDGSVLLESKIVADTACQRPQETLIMWSEGDYYDLALSFQERACCDEIWAKICQVHGMDPSVDITQEIAEKEDKRFDDNNDNGNGTADREIFRYDIHLSVKEKVILFNHWFNARKLISSSTQTKPVETENEENKTINTKVHTIRGKSDQEVAVYEGEQASGAPCSMHLDCVPGGVFFEEPRVLTNGIDTTMNSGSELVPNGAQSLSVPTTPIPPERPQLQQRVTTRQRVHQITILSTIRHRVRQESGRLKRDPNGHPYGNATH